MMHPNSSQLTLQIVYLDDKLILICTGSSGEAKSFVDGPVVDSILKKSITIHRRIDNLKDPQSVSKSSRNNLSHELREFGESLFDSIFRDEILDLFNVAIGQSIRSQSNVIIKLMIGTDFLNIIPWELLFKNGTYICHTYDLLRHPFSLQPVKSPISFDSKIRVLFVGANPRNDLIIDEQAKAVAKAIHSIKAQVTSLSSPEATYTNIANEIYNGVDVLHFLSHGSFFSDGKFSQGYFTIDGEGEKKEDRLSVEMLTTFCRANPMQFAILNACRSDQAVQYSSRSLKKLKAIRYYSMAQSLIQTGVPSVIGMSHRISKIGAEILAKRLYLVMIDQRESITKAVRQARLELYAHTDSLLPSDWLTPVLYSRINIPFISSKIEKE